MKLWAIFLGVTAFFSIGLTVSVGPTPLFCASATDYCRVGESPSMCECCGSHVMTCVERKAIGLERWYPDDPKLNGWYLRAKPCPLHPSIVSKLLSQLGSASSTKQLLHLAYTAKKMTLIPPHHSQLPLKKFVAVQG
ncbi:hypothetical protein B0J15DRAFT_519864 [Fusarium solani]|uniref:Uncharacterized protein n=1 Tax=Fusarium solani TaxID=169388 RepID=A0A9P9RCV4_FUSSL|nr:uncharacterized protein B0J15DRAFT_519864 [Fusarium solani]KAH7273415.1 hypothetical protein B0J15DRAFT_519864 [Fusarium solani]